MICFRILPLISKCSSARTSDFLDTLVSSSSLSSRFKTWIEFGFSLGIVPQKVFRHYTLFTMQFRPLSFPLSLFFPHNFISHFSPSSLTLYRMTIVFCIIYIPLILLQSNYGILNMKTRKHYSPVSKKNSPLQGFLFGKGF